MWTYLLILFSLVTIFGVFIHRVIAMKRVSKVEEIPEEKEIEEEIQKVKKVSRSVNAEVEALYKRGEAMLDSNQDEEAIKCFVQALALNQGHKATQKRLAMLYLQKEMYGAAAALFRELAAAEEDAVHFSHLGLALYQQADYPEALEAYKKAVMIDDSRPQRFVSLTQVYRNLGRLYHALMALEKAMQIKEDDMELAYLFVDIQMELGNFDLAKSYLEAMLKRNPEYSELNSMINQIQGAQDSLSQ